MKRVVLTIAGVAEAVTGLAMLASPSLVADILLGQPLDGMAVLVARVAGLGLMGLGLACWPGPPLLGMLAYSAAVTVYLAYLGMSGVASGVLLWPAVVLHAVVAGGLALSAKR
jgi:hypothetical protein